MILLDTHALLWLESGSERLGARARRMADRALADDELCVSAISFWEVAMLAAKERIVLARSPARLRDELLASGLIEIPLSGDVAIAATELEGFHGDPADRFVVATALAAAATRRPHSLMLRLEGCTTQASQLMGLPIGLPAGEHVEDVEHLRPMVEGEADAPGSDPKSVLWVARCQ